MLFNKLPTGKLLLAGLAAYAYYKYTKMSEQEKRDLVGNIKDKGRKLYEDYVPGNMKNAFNKAGDSATTAGNQFSTSGGFNS